MLCRSLSNNNWIIPDQSDNKWNEKRISTEINDLKKTLRHLWHFPLCMIPIMSSVICSRLMWETVLFFTMHLRKLKWFCDGCGHVGIYHYHYKCRFDEENRETILNACQYCFINFRPINKWERWSAIYSYNKNNNESLFTKCLKHATINSIHDNLLENRFCFNQTFAHSTHG